MTDDERPAPVDTEGKESTADPAIDATLTRAPSLSVAGTQLSLAAAAGQLAALARFGSEEADKLTIESHVLETARRRKDFEMVFLSDGQITIQSNGLADVARYLRAADAIQARARALGYEAQSEAAPITSVPGGYVGRYPGNDIYATG